jgi:cell division protein FtsB
VNLRRVIISIYLLVFLSMTVASGVFFLHTRREYQLLQRSEVESRQQLAEAQLKLREQERILERLRNDPAYVEMVIRRRLGYAKPDEMIFRFESSGDRDLRLDEGARGNKRPPN